MGRLVAVADSAKHACFNIFRAATSTGIVVFHKVRLASLIQVQPWAKRNNALVSHQAKSVDVVLCDA
jgi:hypothetical protein